MYSLCPTVNKSAIVLFWVLPSHLFDFLLVTFSLRGTAVVFDVWLQSEAEPGARSSFFPDIFLLVNLMEH